MTVQREYLETVNGISFKYARKRICDEMPSIKLKSKKWFLWRKNIFGWEYLGFWDTNRDLSIAVSDYYSKMPG